MIYSSPRQLEVLPTGNAVEFFYQSKHFRPSRVALIDPASGKALTAAQARTLTMGLAHVLRHKFGIQVGSVVLVSTLNSIYLQILHHAVLAIGGIVSPANVMYTAKELAHQVESVRPKLLVTGNLALAASVFDNNVLLKDLLDQVPLDGAQQAALEQPMRIDGATPAYYCLSSGTSGLPKTVVLSHTNVAVNMVQWSQQGSELDIPGATVACTLPMSHILALQCYVWMSPYIGCTTVIFAKFELEALLEAVPRYGITSFAVVPPVVLALAKDPRVANYDLSSLRGLASAAAPLSKSLVEAVQQRLGLRVTQFYGQTESSPVTIGAMDTGVGGPLAREYDAGGIGWLMAGTEARIVDPDTLTDTKRGELWIRGPQVMLEYLNNPTATSETIVDGWLRTGDVAVERGGQFQIVDRIKELIKSKGHQVAPAELEGLLLQHPQVDDCAVIGVYDERVATECARAYLVVKPGANVDQIVAEFNRSVAPHKRLFGGAEVLETIPKSPSGKILRRLLRDAAKPKL